MIPDIPTFDDLIEMATSPTAFIAAMWASAWVVRETVVPHWAREIVLMALVVGPLVLVYAVLRHAGVELTGGRCRALTNDGDRCQLGRGPGDDLCHVHQDTYDVTLVEDAQPPKKNR